MAITGKGLRIDPFLISTEADLIALRTHVNISTPSTYFQLANDITMTQNWTPLGTSSTKWRAIFDGRGFKISNVTINHGALDYCGFFGYTDGATIRNLTIENINITGTGTQYGAMAGYAYNTNVENCKIKTGLLECNGSTNPILWGGFVGYFNSSSTGGAYTCKNVIVENVVLHGNDMSGGFAGRLWSMHLNNVLVLTQSTHTGAGVMNSFASNFNSSTVLKRVGVQYNGQNLHSQSTDTYRIKVLYNPTSILEYTSGDNYGWNGLYWSFGEGQPFNMIDGQLPTFTYYGRLPSNPVLLSTFNDLNTKMIVGIGEYALDGYFKLINDITFSSILYSLNTDKAFIGDINNFRASLDGNGFWFKNIRFEQDYTVNNYSFTISLFNSFIHAEVRNLGVEFTSVYCRSNTTYGLTFYPFAKTMDSSIVENIHIKIKEVYTANIVNGFGSISNNSQLKNSIIEWENTSVYTSTSTYGYFVNDFGMSASNAPTIQNIILRINTSSGNPTQACYNGTNQYVNPVYIVLFNEGGNKTFSHTMKGVQLMPSLTEFRNPNNTLYNNFDKVNKWHMVLGQNPIPKAFIKIINKIEQRIISSYSSLMKSLTEKFKGSTKNVGSYSSLFSSLIEKYKGSTKYVLSYSSLMKSLTQKLTSRTQQILSFSKVMLGSKDKLVKTNKLSLSTMKQAISNVLTSRGVLKTSTSFIREIVSNKLTNKKSFKTSTSFMKKAISNIKLILTQRVTSHSNDYSSKINVVKSSLRTTINFVKNIASNHRVTLQNGTLNYPILISTVEDLVAIQSGTVGNVKHYKLTKDISLPYRDARFPISSKNNIHIDGDGYKLKDLNLYSNATGTGIIGDWGVFKSISNATIINLGMSNFNFTTGDTSGAFAGHSNGIINFENCYVENSNISSYPSPSSASGKWFNYGGFIGYAYSKATFKNCFVRNTRISGYSGVGGFIGHSSNGANHVFNKCYVADVTFNEYYDSSDVFTLIVGDASTSYYYNTGTAKGNGATLVTSMTDETQLPNLDFEYDWAIVPELNNGYPIQRIFTSLPAKIMKMLKSFTRKINASARKSLNEIVTIIVTSFVKNIKSSTVLKRVKRRIAQSTSFVERMFLKTSRIRKVVKTKKSHTKRFKSKLSKYGTVLYIRKAFTKPFESASSRFHKRIELIKSFSRKISSLSLSSLLHVITIIVTSHSRKITSKMRKFTNVFIKATVIVKGGVAVILSSVGRSAKLTSTVKSYMSKIASNLIYFKNLPKSITAFVSYKLNNISLFSRMNKSNVETKENTSIMDAKYNKTDINNKQNKTTVQKYDDGGED